jgi:hypothetical protein
MWRNDASIGLIQSTGAPYLDQQAGSVQARQVSGTTRIELLGRFAVLVDGTPIPDGQWRLRKSRSVIKLLALAPGRALHPERVQELLWPQREPASASNNLRQAVYHARRAHSSGGGDGAALLTTSGDLLALAPEIELDVRRQRQQVPAHREQLGAVGAAAGEGAPRVVDGLAQVVRRRRRLALRPEQLLDALGVQRAARRECEQLDHAARFAQAPLAIRYRLPVDQHGEAAEQLDARANPHQLSLDRLVTQVKLGSAPWLRRSHAATPGSRLSAASSATASSWRGCSPTASSCSPRGTPLPYRLCCWFRAS